MLNGGALGTIPIKTGNLTRIPATAIIISHYYEHTVQNNVIEKELHEYSMREQKLSLFANDLSKYRENSRKSN